MLSNWYEHKLLKKLSKNIKWSDSLKHRAKFLSMMLSIGMIPIEIRFMFTDSHHVSRLSIKYARLIRKLLNKSKRATSDYAHCTDLNDKISSKLLKDIQNNYKSGAKNHD